MYLLCSYIRPWISVRSATIFGSEAAELLRVASAAKAVLPEGMVDCLKLFDYVCGGPTEVRWLKDDELYVFELPEVSVRGALEMLRAVQGEGCVIREVEEGAKAAKGCIGGE